MNRISSTPPINDAVKYEAWKNQWVDQKGVGVYSYISEQCHPEQMLLFSKVFFPDFLVVDGGVFLERNFTTEVFNARMVELNGDLARVEKILNNVHIYDLFDQCAEDVSDSIFLQLCNVLSFSWRLVLKEKFPTRLFCVEFCNSEKNYGPVITFYQLGESPR